MNWTQLPFGHILKSLRHPFPCSLYGTKPILSNYVFGGAARKKIQLLSTSATAYRADYGLPKLTPQQVSSVLTMYENIYDVEDGGSVRSIETNQLASNSPIEDRRAEAKFTLNSGMIFGVFDGHGGCACSQALSERLFNYIAVSLLPPDLLAEYNLSCVNNTPLNLLEWKRHENDYSNESMASLYQRSLHRFATESLSLMDLEDEFNMEKALEDAFVRLDEDISTEALPSSAGLGKYNIEALEVAFSGSVTSVAHIDGPHLHVANVGDSRIVMGSLNEESGEWIVTPLTREHNCDNESEVKRILSSHPSSESTNILRTDRLLGLLTPLRAFGDVRFKWSLYDMKQVMKTLNTPFVRDLVPPHYYTPPYLNSKPEVTYHRLTPRDKFIVLASDGLWDMLSPDKVVKLVGEHMAGKQTIDPFRIPHRSMKLSEINDLLLKRKSGLEKQPVDSNVATHLIRNSLGGTIDGIDHGKISAMLTFPSDIVRYYRDDITVTVVFFDTDYLRTCPA